MNQTVEEFPKVVDDGGLAFPHLSPDWDDRKSHRWEAYHPGMSLRDWLAGMALQAVDIQAHVAPPAAEHIARSAYNIADAMLKIRNESDPIPATRR